MVFQNYALYPHMTVRDNLGFALKLMKTPRAEVESKVADAARILGLEAHLDRKPANLSGGQRQRVAMGRAIVRNPAAFLMDEPLSNLDAKLRVQTRTQIAQLQRRLGTTTIYVTHDQIEAVTLGDRIAVMRAGTLQQVGTPAALYAYPANVFVGGFIGSPSMNVLPGRLEGETLRMPLGDIRVSDRLRQSLENGSALRGRDLIVGIRPEHFEDAARVDEPSRGHTFETTIDVLESLGSEHYAYFHVDSEPLSSPELDELAQHNGTGELRASRPGLQMVARLDAGSPAARGRRMELWFDPDRLHLFDAASGLSVLADGRHRSEQTAMVPIATP